jgi:hypothetical protein
MRSDRVAYHQKETINIEPEQSQENTRNLYLIAAQISFGNRTLLSQMIREILPHELTVDLDLLV